MPFLEKKLCKIWENIKFLNLSQQKEEWIIQYQSNYYTKMSFTENYLVTKMSKTEINVNKPVCLDFSVQIKQNNNV